MSCQLAVQPPHASGQGQLWSKGILIPWGSSSMRWLPLHIIHGTGCLGQQRPEPYVRVLTPSQYKPPDCPSLLGCREWPSPSLKQCSCSKLSARGKAFPDLPHYLGGLSALGTRLGDIRPLQTSSPSPGFFGQLTLAFRGVAIDLQSIQHAQGFAGCLGLYHHPSWLFCLPLLADNSRTPTSFKVAEGL